VVTTDTQTVLDWTQLRDATLGDADIMREILAALIDDTGKQIRNLESAIREQDGPKCMRLAHYCKGACANVGANRAAELLRQLEQAAAGGHFADCSASLAALGKELDLLREEVPKD
jgi:HPt (histidine-containing phosphotransfer) domain-containing protein